MIELDPDASRRQFVVQAFEQARQCAFRRGVDDIARPAAERGDRAEPDDCRARAQAGQKG